MLNPKSLQRFDMESYTENAAYASHNMKGEWVRYADVVDMIIESLNETARECSCPKCRGIQTKIVYIPVGVAYLVESAWGFTPYNPLDLSDDGTSVQATEEHLLHSCSCGWKWVSPCSDKTLLVDSKG